MALDHYANAARKGDAWGATKLGMAITDPASLGGSTEWNAAPDEGAVWLTVGAKVRLSDAADVPRLWRVCACACVPRCAATSWSPSRHMAPRWRSSSATTASMPRS